MFSIKSSTKHDMHPFPTYTHFNPPDTSSELRLPLSWACDTRCWQRVPPVASRSQPLHHQLIRLLLLLMPLMLLLQTQRADERITRDYPVSPFAMLSPNNRRYDRKRECTGSGADAGAALWSRPEASGCRRRHFAVRLQAPLLMCACVCFRVCMCFVWKEQKRWNGWVGGRCLTMWREDTNISQKFEDYSNYVWTSKCLSLPTYIANPL